LGLSLSRASVLGHPDSITHQDVFDLNEVIDRDYYYIFSTNDDGWLVGGGEPGPPRSFKLAAKDTAHVEIMRVGTYFPEWGGITEKDIVDVMKSGKILIPQIEVLPTAVVANGDKPPELEIRFDMEPPVPDLDDPEAPLPINWALRFLHNQLFRHFQFPSRFCPGAFHSTIVRKAEFRSPEARKKYFEKCETVIKKWREAGPKPLNSGGADGTNPEEYTSGIWLFRDRENITHFFPPNFYPPYDTPDKRDIIMDVLSEQWDEKKLNWKYLYEEEEQPLEITKKEETAGEEPVNYQPGFCCF